MWIVHWRINGVSGHGSAVSLELAAYVCEAGTSRYGVGTHWVEQA
jgi:hypothetical protein